MSSLERNPSRSERYLRQTNTYIATAAAEILDKLGRQLPKPADRPRAITPSVPQSLAPERRIAAAVLPHVAELLLSDTARWMYVGKHPMFHFPRVSESIVDANVTFPLQLDPELPRTVRYSITTEGAASIDDEPITYAWQDADNAPSPEQQRQHFSKARQALGACSLVLQSASRLGEYEPHAVVQRSLEDLYEVMGGGNHHHRELWALDPVAYHLLPTPKPALEI